MLWAKYGQAFNGPPVLVPLKISLFSLIAQISILFRSENSRTMFFFVKKTMDLYVNPPKSYVKCNIFQTDKIKWGPDEESAPDFALNSLSVSRLPSCIVQ